MRYSGGKARIALELRLAMQPYYRKGMLIVEPFCGAGWVTQELAQLGPVVASDIQTDLIDLWHALQRGWKPPRNVDREQYQKVRNNPLDYPSYYRAFVAYGCSYGGKFWGGFAYTKGRNIGAESVARLESKIRRMKNVIFVSRDYQSIQPQNSLIYCDPPYANSTQAYDTDVFDSKAFWDRMDEWSKNNRVFVSEYQAPPGWVPIWRKKVKTSLAKDNYGERDETLWTK